MDPFEQQFPTVAKYLTTFGPCAHADHEEQYETPDKTELYDALRNTENGTRKCAQKSVFFFSNFNLKFNRSNFRSNFIFFRCLKHRWQRHLRLFRNLQRVKKNSKKPIFHNGFFI